MENLAPEIPSLALDVTRSLVLSKGIVQEWESWSGYTALFLQNLKQ